MKKPRLLLKSKILIASFLISLIPFFYTLYYAAPSPDDFSMADIDRNRNLLVESVIIAKEYWYGWVGMWFSSFYEVLFNPLNLFSDIRGPYGITMMCVLIFFLLSVFVLVKTLVYELLEIRDRDFLTVIYVLTAFVFINIDIYFEIFAWFVGSHYCIAVSLSFIFMALLIKHLKYKRKAVSLAILSLIGLIACSNYLVAVPIGIVYLWLLWYDGKESGSYKKSFLGVNVIPLIFCVIGGVSAVMAPGNFSRREGTVAPEDSLSLKLALQNSFISCSDFTKQLVYNPLLFFGCVILALIFFFVAGKYGLKYSRLYWLEAVTFFAASPILIFPVAYGYLNHDLPNRIQFVYNSYFIAACFFLSYVAGVFLAEKFAPDPKFFRMAAFVIFIGIYVSMINKDYMSDLPCARMVRDRVLTRTFGGGWYDILDEIKYSPDDDVIIVTTADMLYLDMDPLIKSPGLYEEADDGANALVAKYYGKNSVIVIEGDE